MSLTDSILGRPLATSEERAEHIGVAAGIPIFGLDGLTSAAYGPEAAMTLLIPLGVGGVEYGWRIIAAILILLTIVYFSYRQTIAAYPHGGGSYTVATENLGEKPGLLAAAALMIDYILTAAVGISAGVTALTSAVPRLATSYAADMSGDSCAAGTGESARREGHGNGVYFAYVFVCWDAVDVDWGGPVEDGRGGWASDAGGSCTCAAAG